jgi:hypothetical protein
MGDEREFKIRITGDASGVAAAGREGGEALDNLSIKTRNYIERLKEQNIEAERAEVSHRNLRFGLQMLGPEFAEAGHAALVLFANPLTAALVSATFLIGQLIEHNKRLREAIETAPDISAVRSVIEALGQDGMVKAFTDACVSAEELQN